MSIWQTEGACSQQVGRGAIVHVYGQLTVVHVSCGGRGYVLRRFSSRKFFIAAECAGHFCVAVQNKRISSYALATNANAF